MRAGRQRTTRPNRRHPIAPPSPGKGSVLPPASSRDDAARLRAILQTAVEGIITIDARGQIESANPAACQIFGYPLEELLGRNVSMLMPQPDARQHDGYLAHYLRTGKAKIIGIGREVVGRRKDGSVFPMDLAVSELTVSGQRMFTGFVRDISERKRAESRQQLQLALTGVLASSVSLAEAAPKVLQTICAHLNWERGELWDHDAAAGVLRFEQSWQDSLSNYRAFEALTRHLTKAPMEGLAGDVLASRQAVWVPNIANDPAFTRAKAALGEGFNSAIAFPVLARDQVLAVMLFLGRDLRPPDEELMLVLGSLGSQLGQFMERKRAEEAARREHAFSSAILDTAGALVVVLDREGRVVRFNPACEQITGYRIEEARGQHFAELFLPPEEREAVMRVFADLAAGSFPNRHENHWLTRQGGRRWIAWSNSALVDETGEVEYVIGTGIDITHQKRLEQEILRISDLEQRRIGHDLHDGLCQQLAGIEFMSQALRQRLETAAPLNAQVAGQISDLIRQAITQTRGLSHGLSPVMREPGGLMSALHSLAQNTSHRFQVVCRFHCPAPVLLTNDLAATHAYRIAQEAVGNAIRHGRAKRVLIRLQANTHDVALTIQDNGVGFVQGSKEGTGMGLEIMRYRASMIGGKVDVVARPARGVRVICAFPNPPPSAEPRRRKP